VNSGKSLNAADADAFHKHLENQHGFFGGSVHAEEVAVMRFSDGPEAMAATESLVSFAISPKLFAFNVTGFASHMPRLISGVRSLCETVVGPPADAGLTLVVDGRINKKGDNFSKRRHSALGLAVAGGGDKPF
jgi:hypothetical protein